jgi:glycosyltransferase involved in cell wall biosynthesis
MFVSHNSAWGGAENCLYSLLSGLDRSEFEALAVLPVAGPLKDKIDYLGIHTIISDLEWCLIKEPFDLEQHLRFRSGLRARVRALVDCIKRERIDLVFTNSLAVMDGALAAAICGIPHVWHVLEMLGPDPDFKAPVEVTAFFHMVGLLSDKIVCVSESVRKNLDSSLCAEKSTTVHTGIDSPTGVHPFEFNEDHGAPRVCFIGNLSRRKGVEALVEAAPAVLQEIPSAQFLLVGPDGGAEQRIRAAVDRTGQNDYFTFFGSRDDCLDILAGSDLLVLPSITDPLPVIVLEAMMLGKPVVATASGGTVEMIVDGVTGAIVPVGDVSSLATAIIHLLKHPQIADQMGQAARERALKLFSKEKYVSNMQAVLRHCLEPRQEPYRSKVEIAEMLIGLYEGSIANNDKFLENSRKASEYDALVNKIQINPVFKAYHWIKYLGGEKSAH